MHANVRAHDDGSAPRPSRQRVGRGLAALLPGRGATSSGSQALAPAWRGRPDPAHLDSLRGLSDDGEDFARRLWQRHSPEVRVLLLGLVRAVGTGDAVRARACLHTLRGGMGFFGALRLDRLGSLLRTHLADRGTAGSLPLLVAYLTEAERVLGTLDGLAH